ncbi:YcjF family protein [Nisaea acidiphila]|uniref:YcjF family protein n=1 Tax=Nisaea acidiphila TaxID=1862145 RepID=A0A9J7AMS3_9PROT|nr:YcjF family protein [Nisaea acidiphila]UUX48471.1 YcjF family protein [Nisaea acidiphila]
MTAETEAVASEPAVANVSLRREQAKDIVAKYAAWSSAFGVLPIPFADIAGISGTQVAMVVALCKHYGVPFSKSWVRTILGAIVGGVAPWAVTSGVVTTFLKSVPGWGLGVGFVGMAGLSNIATRTIGKLFIEHFEAGGSLEDVDTDAMKESLSEEMKKKS